MVIKINDVYNGSQTSLNNVFNLINLGTPANKELSRILDVKSFEKYKDNIMNSAKKVYKNIESHFSYEVTFCLQNKINMETITKLS